MIQLDQIHVQYKGANSVCVAVKEVSLTIETGSFVSITGRSGSGKTSLLNVIGGLLRPDKGCVLVDEEDIYKMSDTRLSKYRSSHIGYIFQNFFLESHYTVEQNLEIALMTTRCPSAERKDKIKNILSLVGLEDKLKQNAGNLSGGERQRVCIARALINDPKLILADEPCGNLDSDNGAVIMEQLRRCSDAGKTVVLVTHSLEDAMKTDRIINLKDGKVIKDETNRCI